MNRDDYIPSDSEDDMRAVPEESAGGTDARVQITQAYTRLAARAEWYQLVVVVDRLLFLVFLLATVICAIALNSY